MTLYDVLRQLMSGFDLNVVTASAFHPLYSMYECCMLGLDKLFFYFGLLFLLTILVSDAHYSYT